jgi:hypothetical protein
MLDEQNYEACNIYTQLRHHFANAAPTGLRNLDDAMDRLDFVSARKLMLQMPGIGTLVGISAV